MSSLVLTRHQAGYRKSLFCFPEGGVIAQFCGFSLPPSVACFLSVLPTYRSSLSPPYTEAHQRSPPQSEGRYELSNWRLVGARGPSREIPRYSIPRDWWVDFLLSTVTSCTTEALTAILFPWGRSCRCWIDQPCAVFSCILASGRGRWKSFPYCCLHCDWTCLCFFLSSDVLESPLRRAKLLQILSHECESTQVSAVQVFSWQWQEGSGQVCWFPWICSQYQDFSAYYQIHRWPRLFLAPWIYGARFHNTHKGAFIHGRICILLLKKGDKKEEHFTPSWCWHDW